MHRETISGEVRVTARHPFGFPTSELLEHEERRSGLHMPARPGVSKIVPAKATRDTLQARLSEIDEADVRAYCTGEKPVARVVILALERVVEYARNGDHEKMRLNPLCEQRDDVSPILESRWGVLRSRDVR